MPYYERPPLKYNTPKEVISADWGLDKYENGTAYMIVFLTITGTQLQPHILTWVLELLFVKAPFFSPIPNPFSTGTPYQWRQSHVKDTVSTYEIRYPAPNEAQK